MGILQDWNVTIDELSEIIAARPSLRGILQGFLAEYKLSKLWFSDPRISDLVRYDNHDRQRHGDFGFTYRGHRFSVQVKSLQTVSVRRTSTGYVASVQCDASDRRPVRLPNGEVVETTCLATGGFDLLAANLFALEQKWHFAFA